MGNQMVSLASIERRIQFHMQGAYSNILEVGRCLIEAKESDLIPHGQWEAWVNRTAGMSERSAQRLMQAAREVDPSSAMAKLPISKIQAILALPEPQREVVAQRAVDENQSLRELNRTIDALKASLEGARKTEARLTRERDDALTINNRIYKERAEIARDRDRAQHERDEAKAAHRKALDEAARIGRQRDELKYDLEQAKAAPVTGISAEAQAEIDRLNAALADAEQMAEYQAAQRQQAQRELMDIKSQAARGDAAPAEDLTAEGVGQAVRNFMGTMGYLPHSDRLTAMRHQDRQKVLAFARMIGKWAHDVQTTLENVNDAIVMEG